MEYRIVHVYSVDEYHVEWRKYVWNKFKPITGFYSVEDAIKYVESKTNGKPFKIMGSHYA